MQTRRLSVVCLLIVVGLAGCSGLSPFGSDVSYPDGYNESGITDPETAADQHMAALSEHDSYTEERNFTSPKFDGYAKTTIRTDNTDNHSAATLDSNDTGETLLNAEMYHDGNTSYMKSEIDEYDDRYTTIEESSSSFRNFLMNTSRFDRWFTNISFEEAGTVTRDGDTLLRYNATDVDDPEAFFYSSEFSTIDSVESADSTLLVDEEGIIRQFDITVTYRSDGETQEGTMSYRVTNIDSTTVEEPDWLEEAKSKSEDSDPFEDEF